MRSASRAQNDNEKGRVNNFMVLFAASIIGRSVERTVVWVSQHAHDYARSTPDRAGARMAGDRKHTPWQVQTKSIEDGSLIAWFERWRMFLFWRMLSTTFCQHSSKTRTTADYSQSSPKFHLK